MKNLIFKLLDIRDLSIRSVIVDGAEVEFRIAPNSYTFFGSKLCVYLPEDKRRAGSEMSAIFLFFHFLEKEEKKVPQQQKKQ